MGFYFFLSVVLPILVNDSFTFMPQREENRLASGIKDHLYNRLNWVEVGFFKHPRRREDIIYFGQVVN